MAKTQHCFLGGEMQLKGAGYIFKCHTDAPDNSNQWITK